MPPRPSSPAAEPAAIAVRRAQVEALQRRAQAHTGATRELLDAKLQALRAELEAATAQFAAASQPADQPGQPAVPRPLTALHAHLAQHASPPGSELKTLRYFRQTWQRINTGQRLTQSLAKEPEKAGPINSHGLVLRALKQMRQASPEYLERYIAYVDTLLSLDTASGGSAWLPRDVLGTPAAAAAKPRASRAKAAGVQNGRARTSSRP